MNNLIHQQVGHVSEETALVVKNYMLNKVQTDLRYWVETRQPYGQRVMRQVFNTRKGVWWNPKPLTTFSDIVVIYHDADLDLPQQNFTTCEEPIKTNRFMLNDIPSHQLKAFRDYYNFDEVQLNIIDQHIRERSMPTSELVAQSPVTTVQHRAQPLPKQAEDSEVSIARQRKAEAEAQIAEERLRGIRLRNEAAELSLQERRLKIATASAPAPIKPNSLTLEQRLEIEEINHFVQAGAKFIGGDYDMVHEELQRPQMERIIAYCEEHPEYLPSDTARFAMRAGALGLKDQINKLPSVIAWRNPPPMAKPTAAQVKAMEKDLLK